MKALFKCAFVLCSLFFVGCGQTELEEVVDGNISSRSATREISYFKNVVEYTAETGEACTVGEIHCTEVAEYTIIFAFQGDEGASYDAWFGSNHFYPSNGGNFREMTVTLQPGIHKCSVSILFNGPEQQANARLNIVRTSPSIPSSEGYNDLVAEGFSETWYAPSSRPMHWTCDRCHCTLNGDGSDICIVCGANRPAN